MNVDVADVAEMTTWIDRVQGLPIIVIVIVVAVVLAVALKVIASALGVLVKVVLIVAIAVGLLALVDPEMFREIDARVRELVDSVRAG